MRAIVAQIPSNDEVIKWFFEMIEYQSFVMIMKYQIECRKLLNYYEMIDLR